jgi:transposase InsO family protein
MALSISYPERQSRVGEVRLQTTDSSHNIAAIAPDQVWVPDITYIEVGTRFIYLAVILDEDNPRRVYRRFYVTSANACP